MKTQIKVLTGILFISTLFFSCEKTIDFEGDNMEPKIVVNGILISGDTVKASIFESHSLLDENNFFEALTNAKADLYVDNIFLETLVYVEQVDTFRKYLAYDVQTKTPFSNGIFSSQTTVKPGKTYRLEVSSEGLNAVTCETTVPFPVEITGIDTFTEELIYQSTTYNLFHIKLKFEDPGKSENYYRMKTNFSRGYALTQTNTEQTIYTDTVILAPAYGGINTSDPIFNNAQNEANDIIMGAPHNQFAIFDDTKINGSTYNLEAVYQSQMKNNSKALNHGSFDSHQVTFYSLSKQYYNYLNTANYHFWFLEDYFSEPVPVSSNVIGGMGIWGSASFSQYNLIRGTYPMDGKTYINESEYYNSTSGYGGYGGGYSY